MDKDLQDLIDAANKATSGSVSSNRITGGAGDFYLDKVKSGIASGAGNFLDFPSRAANLAKVAVGVSGAPQALSYVTGKPEHTYLPEISQSGPLSPNFHTDILKRLLDVKGLSGVDTGQKVAGGVVEGAVGGMFTPTGLAKNLLADLLKSAGIGALAGGGAEAGGAATKDSALGRLAGALVGGVAAPALFSKYPGAVNRLMTPEQAKTNAAPFVEKIVEGQTRRAVQGFPDAADNITQAQVLRERIPGFNPSVAEMSGAPALADMQRRYAMSSPQNLNAEMARANANQQAVDRFYQGNAPVSGSPSSVRSSVNQSIADQQLAAREAAEGVAQRIPSADQMAVGARMADIAASEKAAARPAINAAYEKAFEADVSKAVSLSPVIAKAEEILGTKLSQVKPETAPNTIAAINRLKPSDVKPSGFGFTQELTAGAPGSANVTLRDVDGIRKAINADIAEAGRSNSPIAATQLRNLYQLHKTIDDAVAASGLKPEAKSAYADALNKYRTEFAPRFNEGSNLRMFRDTSLNEPRILPDKFTSEYFKPDSQGGITKAMQFGNLFGKNSEALQTTRAGILDKYRDAVIDKNTGVVNLSAHNRFVADHKDTLRAFSSRGVNVVDDISNFGKEAAKVANAGRRIQETAAGLKYDTVDGLVDAALKNPRVMGNTLARLDDNAKDQLRRMLMDRARNAGGASGMSDFINNNKKTLQMALTPQHVSALDDVASALKVMERSPLAGRVSTEGPDIVKNMTGVSTATVWAQYRATTAGRQGLATGLFNLAAPVATKLGQREFSDIMENALHNPETAKRLRDFLLAQNAGQANMAGAALSRVKEGANLLWDAKGPIAKYALGTRYYGPNVARAGPVLGNETQQGQQ